MSYRITEETYQEYLFRTGKIQQPNKIRKQSKFRNIKVKIGPFLFDSKAEARRYGELKILESGGLLKDLIAHPRFALQYGKLKRHYEADFSYWDIKKNQLVVEDVKSKPTRTQLFIRNKAMMLEQYSIDVQEVHYS